jgi:diacylglycerol kinase (ATP)
MESPPLHPSPEAARLRAARHPIDGLRSARRGERSFGREVWNAEVLARLTLGIGRSGVDVTVRAVPALLALPVGCTLRMRVVQPLNVALERAADRICGGWHEMSERARDLGNAAVLVSQLSCGGIWQGAPHRHAWRARARGVA